MARTLRQAFKNTFQPAEIAVKKALGIKKLKKGQLFDEQGFVKDGREKLTRYALFVPFYQKIKFITNVNEFSNGVSFGTHSQNGGGGRTLYTLKTCYKIFGIQIFSKTTIYFQRNSNDTYRIHLSRGIDIGQYVIDNPKIDNEIYKLVDGLSQNDKKLIFRQISRSVKCCEYNENLFSEISNKEFKSLKRIYVEFFPNIFRLNKDLYVYNGFFLPINHFEESVFYYEHGLHKLETKTLDKIRQKDIIDVGGFIGDSAIIFERKFTHKNVYTFEPTKENYQLMKRTIELNNAKRIIPINKGLGAKSSEMKINILGSSSSVCFDWGVVSDKETIKITSLDEFVCKNNIEIGFIKVDIEGFEMEFLKGAKKTICDQKPAMLISIYHQPSDYFNIKPLIESWNLGYKFKIYKGIDFTIMNETVLLCEIF